jgi:hypothetical protein
LPPSSRPRCSLPTNLACLCCPPSSFSAAVVVRRRHCRLPPPSSSTAAIFCLHSHHCHSVSSPSLANRSSLSPS